MTKKELVKIALKEFSNTIAKDTIDLIEEKTKPLNWIEKADIYVIQEVINILNKKIKKHQ